jgi:dolichol kinase
MSLLLAVIAIFTLLVISELWWRKTKVRNEFTRKFVHISVGTFVAFFPYFLTTDEIKIISGAFLVCVLISKYFNLFKAIHSVQRLTDGEFWFALTVLLLAVLPFDSGIFTVSLLVMSLADGFAGVVGSHFGKSNEYKVLGCTKSLAGTATFFVISCTLLVGYSYFTVGQTVTAWFVGISLLATVLENFSKRGIDNLTVPMSVACLLYLL